MSVRPRGSWTKRTLFSLVIPWCYLALKHGHREIVDGAFRVWYERDSRTSRSESTSCEPCGAAVLPRIQAAMRASARHAKLLPIPSAHAELVLSRGPNGSRGTESQVNLTGLVE